jgi:bifunctional non-homologous end joining protein LigD
VFAFEQLLRTRADRDADRIAVSYIAFDLLAHPELGDVRSRPLAERVTLLAEVPAGTGPPLELVMATADRDEALHWQDVLAPAGVQGLVCKGWATAYRPRSAAAAWVEVRGTGTTDAIVVGVIGTARRPHTLLIELPDGRKTTTSPRLDSRQARQVADAAAGRRGAPVREPAIGLVAPLSEPLFAEIALGTGRDRTARFIRIRDV